MTAPRSKPESAINCAVCGKPCKFVRECDEPANGYGGWYCVPCGSYTETDVEVED